MGVYITDVYQASRSLNSKGIGGREDDKERELMLILRLRVAKDHQELDISRAPGKLPAGRLLQYHPIGLCNLQVPLCPQTHLPTVTSVAP